MNVAHGIDAVLIVAMSLVGLAMLCQIGCAVYDLVAEASPLVLLSVTALVSAVFLVGALS